MARRRNKSEERGVASRRIDALLRAANAETLAGRRDLAHRYGMLSLRVAQKYQSGLTPSQKVQLCRKCGTPRSAATSRTRLHAGRLVTTCLSCGAVARRPLHALPAPLPALPPSSRTMRTPPSRPATPSRSNPQVSP
jgi:RNase P subunit RPR2